MTCNAVPIDNSNDTSSCPATYINLNYPGGVPGDSTFFTGVRASETTPNTLVSGNIVNSAGQSAIIYDGNITSGCGDWYVYNYPGSNITVAYGPNSLSNGDIQFVGDSHIPPSPLTGYIYEGPKDGSGNWTVIDPSSLTDLPVEGTMVHSVMGGYAVGNYLPAGTLGGLAKFQSFIYNIDEDSFQPISYPGAYQTTSYGIWHNGGDSYTIAGGYANQRHAAAAYIVDWDSTTKSTSNWKSFYHNNDKSTTSTHFEGITSDGNGGYNLAANTNVEKFIDTDFNLVDQFLPGHKTSIVNVDRISNGGFGTAKWTDYEVPDDSEASSNTVFENKILGVTWGSPTNTYVATFGDCLYDASTTCEA